MSYRYIDPGFGFSSDGLSADTCFYPSLLSLENPAYNRNFGVAFYTNADTSNGYSTIRFGNGDDTSPEFYLKFDEYFPASADYARIIIRNGEYQILTISQFGNNVQIRALNDDDLTLTGDETHLETGRVNTIWIHCAADGQTGRITLAINGNYIFREQEGWGFVGPITRAFSFIIDEELPVSNFIISDEAINLNETIVELDYSAIETTMIEQSNTYSSAGAGDYVLQTLDPSSLYSQFNSSTRVTAMLAVAVPAYTTGDAVKSLTCRVADGDNITDYEILDTEGYRISLQKMSEDEFASLEGGAPLMAKQIAVASDTTFASLSGLKVGWVTGS